MPYDEFKRSEINSHSNQGSDSQANANSAIDENDSLDWAKEAYAKLKAKQDKEKALISENEKKELVSNDDNISGVKDKISSTNQVLPLYEETGLNNNLIEQVPSNEEEVNPIDESPILGEFDENFTWSANVLAAQGKKPGDISFEEIDWLGKLRDGLEKTRQGFVTDLLEKFGDDPLTPEDLDDLEVLLLRADVGVKATDQIIDALRKRLNEEVLDSKEAFRFLKEQLCKIVEKPIKDSGQDLLFPKRNCLNIWLLVGVNGVGKTTTLGKLANLALRSQYSSLIAAADTFRVAAVEQVKIWGSRSGVSVIANETPNADPAAVVFDAIGAAKSKKTELLLVDTAGRLQTKNNLMEELAKIAKIITRLAPDALVESLLVLDATQGQNGLSQAMSFAKSANLSGVVITKLDGSSRGGVAFAIASEANLPIRFIGAGEGIQDLKPFNSFEFVEALLANR